MGRRVSRRTNLCQPGFLPSLSASWKARARVCRWNSPSHLLELSAGRNFSVNRGSDARTDHNRGSVAGFLQTGPRAFLLILSHTNSRDSPQKYFFLESAPFQHASTFPLFSVSKMKPSLDQGSPSLHVFTNRRSTSHSASLVHQQHSCHSRLSVRSRLYSFPHQVAVRLSAPILSVEQETSRTPQSTRTKWSAANRTRISPRKHGLKRNGAC